MSKQSKTPFLTIQFPTMSASKWYFRFLIILLYSAGFKSCFLYYTVFSLSKSNNNISSKSHVSKLDSHIIRGMYPPITISVFKPDYFLKRSSFYCPTYFVFLLYAKTILFSFIFNCLNTISEWTLIFLFKILIISAFKTNLIFN